MKTNKPSIEYLAEELHLLPISPAIRQHFTNSTFHSQQLTSTLHAYLSMECFKELLRRSNMTLLSRFKGTIWGWVLLVAAPALTIQIIMGSLKMKLLLQELMEFPHLPLLLG